MSERRASLEKDDARPTRHNQTGKAETEGEMSNQTAVVSPG